MVVLVCVELGEQRSPQIVGGESLLEWLLHEEQSVETTQFDTVFKSFGYEG